MSKLKVIKLANLSVQTAAFISPFTTTLVVQVEQSVWCAFV